ncbi:MAG: excinuclease ABC subunit UvrA [Burkholderiaceae bacterium]|nr:excinuclease ABC subunit UvrA [Burkholderiaceae bacterium]
MDKNIRIFGAQQNNLKNLDVEFETGKISVVTGVSGSGKSSLVFDTLYAEGQRRYVETFSPYARQFLDRMDRPQVDRIEGVPPAIAIDQTNPVRTSRSTVGTMTELNDHLKLFFAQQAKLYCECCGELIENDTPASIWSKLGQRAQQSDDPRLFVTFMITVPSTMTVEEVTQSLAAQGFTKIHRETTQKIGRKKETSLWVVADRFRHSRCDKARGIEAIETALRFGKGSLTVFAQTSSEELEWRFTERLACPQCGTHYSKPTDSSFSFNSPLGACETCRGFGRVIGVDYSLVIPDESLSLLQGAVKPWNTATNQDCLADMKRYAARDGIRLDVPYRDLTQEEKDWVIHGEPGWKGKWRTQWYGVEHFFQWLETKAYKMHVRVLLSRYRNYQECPDCQGARLKPEWLLWRVGTAEAARVATEGLNFVRHRSPVATFSDEVLNGLPGLNLYDLMRLPLERLLRFFETIKQQETLDQAACVVIEEMLTRMRYLVDVGVGYLTLDRQSRTLSGGEVQRVNLTTALGTSLVNTLFVLDEPSIGLHPRDMDRINAVMQRLRNAGNTLVVVEHDPQVMLAADHIFDMGPGPGEKGGEIVFSGTPADLMKADTLTARYLSGRERIDAMSQARPIGANHPCLHLKGVKAHNLKNIDVTFPLHAMTVVTGVSGSGKSTLIENVLVPALLKAKGKPTEAAGSHAALIGENLINELYFVDQSPIGKTTRSNPASYVGAFDAIRALFAQTDTAKAREYKPGTFSFNSGDGRCPVCGGNGFEHIEMQFLSDVYLRCTECNGTRYRPEILEVTLERGDQSLNIAQVLDLSVSQACEFFKHDKAVLQKLEPLQRVGLDYLRLGQPVPTLSGGEAQRLKIAGYLAEKKKTSEQGDLFVFDEPTTGLHFYDIAKLMTSLQELVNRGHSVIVIEHNLDVINSADWVIDLGPDGGENGGQIVEAGPLDVLLDNDVSYTAKALRTYRETLAAKNSSGYFTMACTAPNVTERQNFDAIRIQGAKEHNLKNVTVDIPHDAFTVITGVSGSGKSTLAFDIVFKEGQRRYLESLNAYARSIVQPAAKPHVDSIAGIAPTVAIEQRTSRGGRKSTVATMTELYHFLRLLYVKLGKQYCPTCNVEVTPKTFEEILADVVTRYKGHGIEVLAPLVVRRKGIYNDLAKWALKKGYTELRVDGKHVSTEKFPKLARYKDHTIELPIRSLTVDVADEKALKLVLQEALTIGKGLVSVVELDSSSETIFSTHRSCPCCGTSFPELDPRLFSYNSSMGWCPTCFGTGQIIEGFDENASGEERQWQDAQAKPCPSCHGARLNPTARFVRFAGLSIAEMTQMTVSEAKRFFEKIRLSGREAEIANDALIEIRLRLSFLEEVGLGYLSLDRSSPTLSGGEAQRIRLASQLGSNLQGVCYILDEPTIGLHPRDNQLLLDSLSKLVDKGNTLIVVEHDEDTIRQADCVIDVGPGAGVRGGQIIAKGTVDELADNPQSITGRYLKTPIAHTFKAKRPIDESTQWIEVIEPRLNNLCEDKIAIPIDRLTVLTGVSGSGKSSFARGVLLPALSEMIAKKAPYEGPLCQRIAGAEAINRVLEVDQTPIGKTPRSCPATYVGFMDAMRRLYSGTNEAQARGYGISRFSFNTKGGRCEACEGQGMRTIEMSFLPDVKVPCEVCGGKRFNDETLEVLWKGKSIGDALAMDIDEAVSFFETQTSIAHALRLMQDVGLGYLSLGQPSPTLSGGEAQRIKLVTELIKARDDVTRRGYRAPKTLYILDEPTVGLHMADVEKLIAVLHRLVDAGNTVIVIEHNQDVMAQADWIIDMGPEGGDQGGHVVACGMPNEILRKKTHTARALKAFKKEHDRRTKNQ